MSITTTTASIAAIRKAIRDVPDFPKPGILFKDITPVLHDPKLLKSAITLMAQPFEVERIDVVLGIEARGFIFGSAIANYLHAGFVPVRKSGKLPWRTKTVSYALEYGEDTLQIHTDAVAEGAHVLIVDDLLATGGTAGAVLKLVEECRGHVAGLSVLVELEFLKGRERLSPCRVASVVQY